ncbi:MAG: RNA polymerase sigma factor [Planctomycetes bacterium]|nr:RNA polymerase sigma factor [Planctomycetota bacterium]
MNEMKLKDSQGFFLARSARLRAYVHLLTGDMNDADDIMQEVFLKYLDKGPQTSDPQAERWLFRVARNQALDSIRGGKRRTRREQAYQPASGKASDDPAAIFERDESLSRIGRCLERLSEELREMVYLKFVEELSLNEISEWTGMPRSTVALRVQEGLVRLSAEFHGAADADR